MWKVFGLTSRVADKNQNVEVVLCEDLCVVHFGQLLLNVLNVLNVPSLHEQNALNFNVG